MPKIESEKIDCLHRSCSRPAPRGKIKSIRTHSEVSEEFDSFSLLKLLFLVRNWHCWSRKAFTRQMTPKSEKKTAKTAVFRDCWQAWKVVRSIAAVRQRPRTPPNWRCSFAFFESFLWHFNKKQHAEVIFRLSRPVLCKNQENGSGKQWSLHAPWYERKVDLGCVYTYPDRDVLYPEAEEIPASISRAFIFTEAQPRWIWRGKYSAGISEAEGYKVLIPAENRCRGYGCVKFTVQSELSQLKTGAGGTDV